MLQWIAKILMPWLLERAVKLGARAFRDARGPEVHGKRSQKYMWDKVWLPLINWWRSTPNEADDLAADYTYYFTAGYITDGRLAELIRSARGHVSRGATLDALRDLGKALALIEPPYEDQQSKTKNRT